MGSAIYIGFFDVLGSGDPSGLNVTKTRNTSYLLRSVLKRRHNQTECISFNVQCIYVTITSPVIPRNTP